MSFKHSKFLEHSGTVLVIILGILMVIRIGHAFLIGHPTPESELLDEIFMWLFMAFAIHMLLAFRERRKWGEENYRYFMTVYRLMKQHDKEEVTPEQIITQLKELVS